MRRLCRSVAFAVMLLTVWFVVAADAPANSAPRQPEDSLGVSGGDTAASLSVVVPKRVVVLIEIKGMIDGGLAAFMERTIALAEEEQAAAILIDMNTYGGRVDAADIIRTALINTSVPTITFINPNAASAGALISIATDSIAMSPGSAIGAATPVDQTGTAASSKVISYFRTLMRATALATGRDPKIAEAMVDSSVVVPGLEDAPRPLTLSAEQAIRHGIAQHEAKTIDEVVKLNGLAGATIRRIETNWAEHIVRFLTNPLVASLLMTIGALGLIYELTSPGFGLAGTAGVVCLTLFFGSHWIVKLAELQELLIFAAGVVLIIAELFVPGGILGIIGGSLIVVGLFLSLVGDWEFVTPIDLNNAFISVGIALVLTFVGAVVVLKSFTQMPFFHRFLLETRQQPGKGEVLLVAASKSDMLGREGVAQSPLRPSGRVFISGRSYDAVTDGEHIEADTPIKVVAVDGLMGLIVRRI